MSAGWLRFYPDLYAGRADPAADAFLYPPLPQES